MKQSSFLLPTLRDVPSDAEVKSHQLMLRAGMMKQIAAGVYAYLPLAKRVIQKVENVVREEMNKTGAQELTMPTLHPSELWQETGRWDKMGGELIRLQDRHNRDFALGPTHEEVITSIVRDYIQSYKKLPINLYQIQTKFRDERRPRFGLLRGREFIMKDAYSFHTTSESLDEEYQAMYDAYSNVFSRVGLSFRPVIADSGAMGGKDTHEFMALADVGEDTIAYSDSSDYAANIEMAAVKVEEPSSVAEMVELVKVQTGEAKTIEAVVSELKVETKSVIKSLLVKVDDEMVLVLIRGDHELNEVKLKHALEAKDIRFASDAEVEQVMGVAAGNIGPVGTNVKVVADYAVKAMANSVCGANEKEAHYTGVNAGRDYQVSQYADLRFIQEGEPSPDGKGTIQFAQGIEVGQVFKLGTFYSESMGASVLDENGKSKPILMGCYGIGVSRTVAAIIEQHHDENGIIWPYEVAPFQIHLLAMNSKNAQQKELADHLYTLLQSKGYEVLYDDRPERAGVKFKDSDLIGLPIRIAVGKRASEGIVELKMRKSGEMVEVAIPEIEELISNKVLELKG
ncbi:prolyl-tRNA synthetase [Alkalihalobacillus alcalophilus ATCC 27647 = CGMCC 1.3604]|uniref:Proline--tRNA ligase n=1 Tax=Alkalihalobacillus alcalophilus ATCC 27647 = CGMCC 1.3604 TaxID=1218173 RepID=A0A094WMY3_ALKAL|nr:proline--tRNA ligase [Alkalihalobacillus alcalophilus]KGA98216.1 prolyl-tRNA synthetase [Alkalihalobacillus alcalophilus ATCC 27647 = CGMCC 1.3604]MED1562155.1 proline--tRNA ligase [Alkalihalobacillus alcalophilus]THG91380.1 prolyl-tRNA synthetase [Alkalihalobacillus alcalophilus ATCC 27647 = CGMCC 1.3604]